MLIQGGRLDTGGALTHPPQILGVMGLMIYNTNALMPFIDTYITELSAIHGLGCN